MADIRKLTDDVSVAAQINFSDVDLIKQGEFRSILCNRPDYEEDQQPLYSEIEEAAKEAGIEIVYQPVNGRNITDDNIDDFEDNLESMEKPVLAYCRTGTRCSVLWALSQAGKMNSDEILKTTASAGYALEGLLPRILDREQD